MTIYDVRYRAEFDNGKITKYAKKDVVNGFLQLKKSKNDPDDKYFIIETTSGKKIFVTPSEIDYLRGKNGEPGNYEISFIARPLGAEVHDLYTGPIYFDANDMNFLINAISKGKQKINLRDLVKLEEIKIV